MVHHFTNLTHLIAEEVGVDSCAIAMRGRPIDGSGQAAADLEDWQFVLGEGPAVNAYASRRPEEFADRGSIIERSPLLAEHLLAAGITSVAAFPINPRSGCLGTVTLYSHHGGLTRDQAGRAEGWAQQLGQFISADPDAWANHRSRVTPDFNVAVGYVIASCAVDAATASALIRARAFAQARPLRELCNDIVHHAYRLDVEMDC